MVEASTIEKSLLSLSLHFLPPLTPWRRCCYFVKERETVKGGGVQLNISPTGPSYSPIPLLILG